MSQNKFAKRLPIEGPDDFRKAFSVSRETIEKLELYAELLVTWQNIKNLVAPSTLTQIWHRHFADSAQLVGHGSDANRWTDLGSGAGFPGLVIAIMLADQDRGDVCLIESNSRKCAFLSEVARQTRISVDIKNERIETRTNSAKVRESVIITARALAPLKELLCLAEPFFGADTKALFLKGQDAQSEIKSAEQAWSFSWRMFPSQTDSKGQIVEITNLEERLRG